MKKDKIEGINEKNVVLIHRSLSFTYNYIYIYTGYASIDVEEKHNLAGLFYRTTTPFDTTFESSAPAAW